VKILHIVRSVNPDDGGPIEGIKQLGASLVADGHQVEVASLDDPAAPYLASSLLPVYPLGPTRSKYGFSPRFAPWLRANASRFDAAIVNGIWQYQSLSTWRTLRNSSLPYVVFTHGMLDPWFKKQYPLKHLKKWMYWPWADYRVLRDAHAVLFTCEEERRLASSSFWLYRCNEVVVSLGTANPEGDPDLERQEFFARYPELRGKRLALFMGRIHPKKGCDLLIEAFAETLAHQADWQLVMAGPDQVGWRKELSDRADQLGISSRVTWTGMLAGAVKWGALRAAEVFVLPSHQENFGIAVAEALAAGVPALISDKVNIWREIKNDQAGIVADDTLAGTCKLFQSYLGMTAHQRQMMRSHARDCFEQRFEIRKAAQTLHAVLSSAVALN
jgi:glycosyltransferase involved in cell wall biosynthesis